MLRWFSIAMNRLMLMRLACPFVACAKTTGSNDNHHLASQPKIIFHMRYSCLLRLGREDTNERFAATIMGERRLNYRLASGIRFDISVLRIAASIRYRWASAIILFDTRRRLSIVSGEGSMLRHLQ